MLCQKQPMNSVCPPPLVNMHMHSVQLHFIILTIHTESHLSREKSEKGDDWLK